MRFPNIPASVLFMAGIAALWQAVYFLGVFPELLFPSIGDIGRSLFHGFHEEQLTASIFYTLGQICTGLAIGIGLATIFSTISILHAGFRAYYGMSIACMDSLPGIALLPLAVLWFGTGEKVVVFIVVHSVLWPFSEYAIRGFSSTPAVHVEAGKSIGLGGLSLVLGVYLPSATPYLISGLKTCWGRSWRAVLSAEMVFGTSGAVGGVGWHIFRQRYLMNTPGVFAAVAVIMLIGLLIEYGAFLLVEKHTVKKWGMTKT